MYAFTESWLKEHTQSHLLFGPSYNVFRQDRSAATSNRSCGGGVLLAIRSSLTCQRLYPPNCAAVEQIWASIKRGQRSTFLCVLYIPPDRVSDITVMDQHIDSLSWIIDRMNIGDDILILGDFNLRIKWIHNNSGYLYPDASHSTINSLTAKLLDSYSTAGLIQLNHIVNDNRRLLDLCFSSCDSVNKYSIALAPSPLVKRCRHHPPLLITAGVSSITFKSTCESIIYCYRRTDFNAMNQFFTGIDWFELLINADVDSATSTISNVIVYAIDQFTPKTVHRQPPHPPWSNNHLKRLKRLKRSALRKTSKFPARRFRIRYAITNNRYKKLNSRLFKIHLAKVQRSLISNPKYFWKYVSDQRNETGLPSVMNLDESEANSVQDCCKLFRKQFQSVFVAENLTQQEISNATSCVPLRQAVGNHPQITVAAVKTALKKLKSSVGVGPDGIPSIVLKNCSLSLALPFTCLFNQSLTRGTFPSLWKKSFVFPVHKKGPKSDIKNYRGIAALCAGSKLFELVVYDFLLHHCSQYISSSQHGFTPKRSTNTNLVSYTNFLLREMHNRKQVDAIYTDLSAAFDKINHQIAVAKFERIGFGGSFLSWIRSYLTNRQMAVKIGDVTSDYFDTTSGVPQGSHLGPLTYLVYGNDIHLVLQCGNLSFADDLKLFLPIESERDAFRLQEQLNLFSDWCFRNRMVLNASKCSIISFTRKINPIQFNYSTSGVAIKRETTVKDLGILLDSKLTFKDHIAYVASKASKLLGFVFRSTKHFKSTQCLLTLYCSLVRSTLEYGSIIWAPHYQNSIHRIEAVQRKFTRFALRHIPPESPNYPTTYEGRCLALNLDLLSVRRDLSGTLFVSDLLTGNIDCVELVRQLNFNSRPRVLRSYHFLYLSTSRTNYARNEPLSRMYSLFNYCYEDFDFNVPRRVLSQRFLDHLRISNFH